ncbi:MAG TPA: RDD family protein [Terriglobales bacterium]|nr:RDD family protein [Terriglobales bacterium]
MACPRCGDPCTCGFTQEGTDAGSHVAVLIDPEDYTPSEESFAASLEGEALEGARAEQFAGATSAFEADQILETGSAPAATAARDTPVTPLMAAATPVTATATAQDLYRSAPPNGADWRQEVASRLHAYRSRRRRRAENASLSLNFEAEGAAPEAPNVIVFPRLQVAAGPAARVEYRAPGVPEPPPVPAPSVPVAETEELAEPVADAPQILEAPPVEEAAEAVSSELALALETDEAPLPADAENIDLPLPVAPIELRLFAALVDVLVVLVATVLFAAVFLQIAGTPPAGKLLLAALLAVPTAFWCLYQYLFLVYGGTTPGMRVARLELRTFEGERPWRVERRNRALAVVVSCISLGLGFLWSLVDEDSLAWHDRITRTFLIAPD